MEAYSSSKPEAWSQIGHNIGQDINYSHIGSGVRVGRIQELLLWNKAIPYPRKENVMIYSYKKHQVIIFLNENRFFKNLNINNESTGLLNPQMTV